MPRKLMGLLKYLESFERKLDLFRIPLFFKSKWVLPKQKPCIDPSCSFRRKRAKKERKRPFKDDFQKSLKLYRRHKPFVDTYIPIGNKSGRGNRAGKVFNSTNNIVFASPPCTSTIIS